MTDGMKSRQVCDKNIFKSSAKANQYRVRYYTACYQSQNCEKERAFMGSLNTVKMNQMALPGLDPVQPAIEQLATAGVEKRGAVFTRPEAERE